METVKDFSFILPTRIIFGCNSAQKIGEEAKLLGLSKMLIVTDKNFSKLPIFQTVTGHISDAGLKYRIFSKLTGEPETEIAEEGARFLREEETDGILGIGGGSSIDLAKALSVLGTNEGSVTDYMGVNLVKRHPLPLIAIPTTAGTGSEVTGVSVLTDPEKRFKGAIVSPWVPPKVSILDPVFLTTLPSRVIAETGIDALTHAIEAFYSLGANPISDVLAKESIRRIFLNLRALAANPQNLDAAGNMMLGSLLAGAAFLNTRTGNVHSLSHPLGSYYHIPHGLAIAVLLPHVMAYNLPASMERFAEMAIAMGATVEGLTLREAAQKAVDEVRCLLADLGIPAKMSKLGVTDEHFREMAVDATKIPPYLYNPRRCTVDELIMLYKKAL
jgi:alcohol dehydrogenase class IV